MTESLDDNEVRGNYIYFGDVIAAVECRVCGDVFEDFAEMKRDARRPGGVDTICKPCRAAQVRQRRKAAKQHVCADCGSLNIVDEGA